MKERPILFTAPMVRALLDGSKTQTRRVVKPWDSLISVSNKPVPDDVAYLPDFTCYRSTCPYGDPGDRLWVRETWQHSNYPAGPYQEGCQVFFRADYLDDPHGPDGELSSEGRYRFWNASIHMPRAASRILLEILSVRVERLQGISEEDAKSEGIRRIKDGFERWHPCPTDTQHEGLTRDPVLSYRGLWESIYGAGSWNANPWVWVLEFKQVQP